ncbi:IS110 family transposase [Amycolatopsis pithecellobii]|uniref:IS110 family transposase n=1 Tax=Amycolatopsis pithecellobii TaxID=664692 RepID=UPI0028A68BEA|nr:transposase [Amycolatopsis pithecellobii]
MLPVKPNAIKAWREAEVLSGAKSDPGDAHVIADYLRVRFHRRRPAAPLSSHTKALRAVVRTRSDLVEARIAATNQLAALLDAHWPGAKAIFANIESAIALAFLTRYPTAASAASLTEKRVETRRRRAGPAALGPVGTLDPVVSKGIQDAVLAQAGMLTALNTAIKALDRSIAEKMNTHPDGEVFRSFPRAGTINAAQILAEWGDAREAFNHPDAIAELQRGVSFRWACNKRLRLAITTFAANSRFSSAWTDGAAGKTAHPTIPLCTAAPVSASKRRSRPDFDLQVDTGGVMTPPGAVAPSEGSRRPQHSAPRYAAPSPRRRDDRQPLTACPRPGHRPR